MGNCSAKGNSVKQTKKRPMQLGVLQQMLEIEGGDDYGDDTSIGDDYFRVDMSENWTPEFIEKISRKWWLPSVIDGVYISHIYKFYPELNQFMSNSIK